MIKLLYGESSAGKDFYVKKQGWKSVVSHTTRQPRPGELNGKDKWFDKISDYLLAKEDDSVIAETNIQGNQYWTTEKDFEGKDIFIVDIAGILYLMDRYGKAFKDKFEVLYLDVPWPIRIYRIIRRDGIKKGISRFISDRKTFSSSLKKALKIRLKLLQMHQSVIRWSI